MSKVYEEEEKRMYIEAFKARGKKRTAFARENNIPEATFRSWVKEEEHQKFGAIVLNEDRIKIKQSTIFVCEDIKIELKDGYNKELFKKIVEVLTNDK